ncbi:MAG: ABC transporter permease [Halobacteriota archaeon]
MSTGASQGRGSVTDLIPDVLVENRRVAFVESLIAILLAWQIVYTLWPDFAGAFTSPIAVADATIALLVSMQWVQHLGATLRHVFYGFSATVILGTIFGVGLGWYEFWERAFQDYLTVFLAMPSLFAAIFAAMWFGIGDTAPMVASVVIAFPFLAENVYEGTKDIDNDLLELGLSFDISRNRMIKRVIIPSILPSWFAGIRYALALAWKISNLAEFIAAREGVGFMIRFEMRMLDLTETLAWVVFFVGFLLFMEYAVFAQLEKRLFSWRQEVSIGWA